MIGPHKCPVCVDDEFYGRHIFPDEPTPPFCPNHPANEPVVPLVPCAGAKDDPREAKGA